MASKFLSGFASAKGNIRCELKRSINTIKCWKLFWQSMLLRFKYDGILNYLFTKWNAPQTGNGFHLCVLSKERGWRKLCLFRWYCFFHSAELNHCRVPATISSYRSLDKLWNWQWREEKAWKTEIKNLPFKELLYYEQRHRSLFLEPRQEKRHKPGHKNSKLTQFCDYIIVSRLPSAICCWLGFNLPLRVHGWKLG